MSSIRKYVNHIPSSAIFSLWNSLENCRRLDSNLMWIHCIMCGPNQRPFQGMMFSIFVQRSWNCFLSSKNQTGITNASKAVVHASDMINGIETEVALDDNEAYQFLQSRWVKVVGTTNSEEEQFSFIKI